MKLVQGMYASLLPVGTEIRLVQGMTTLWALVYVYTYTGPSIESEQHDNNMHCSLISAKVPMRLL